MTSVSVPLYSMPSRSAASNVIRPSAGRNESGRHHSGPAWPRICPTPLIVSPLAKMSTSSIVTSVSPSICSASMFSVTSGRSPTMTVAQRSAAAAKAACWVWVRPPRNRTSIVNGESVPATSLARTASARAMWFVNSGISDHLLAAWRTPSPYRAASPALDTPRLERLQTAHDSAVTCPEPGIRTCRRPRATQRHHSRSSRRAVVPMTARLDIDGYADEYASFAGGMTLRQRSAEDLGG
jgi:hypothetical protein